MIRFFLFFIILIISFSCKKPYGQNPLVTESVPDSLSYPELTEIEDNDDPFQYYRLGRIKYEQGETAEALEYAREAIKLDNENALYFFLLAQIQATDGKTNEALENALKSYSLGYVNPDLQVLIARLYFETGDTAEGKRFLDVALKKRPKDPVMTFLRAQIYLEHNDSAGAMQWINKSLALDSTYVDAYQKKAQILIAWDSIDGAIDQLREVYNAEPENKENIFTIASLELQQDNPVAARPWLLMLIELDSANNAANLLLSETYLEQRMYDSARYFAERALQYDSTFNDARLLIARSYDRQYQYSRALEVYYDIVSRDSTFDIAIVEMEVLEKKIAYLRRRRAEQDSIQENAPEPIEDNNNSEDQND